MAVKKSSSSSPYFLPNSSPTYYHYRHYHSTNSYQLISIPSHPSKIRPFVVPVSLVVPPFLFTYSHPQALLYVATSIAGPTNGSVRFLACLVFNNTLGPSPCVYKLGALSSQRFTFLLGPCLVSHTTSLSLGPSASAHIRATSCGSTSLISGRCLQLEAP